MFMKFLLLVSISFIISFSAFGADFKISAAKEADIIKLMTMTGTSALAAQSANAIMEKMIDDFKKTRPDLGDRITLIVKDEMKMVINEATVKNSFYDMFFPIYDKYFSHDDIRGLIKFYNSDLGKKIIRVLPQFSSESMNAGLKWGEALVPVARERLTERFKKEGIDLSK
jgi:uncharacterized protein